jgi:hypothetical protein
MAVSWTCKNDTGFLECKKKSSIVRFEKWELSDVAYFLRSSLIFFTSSDQIWWKNYEFWKWSNSNFQVDKFGLNQTFRNLGYQNYF